MHKRIKDIFIRRDRIWSLFVMILAISTIIGQASAPSIAGSNGAEKEQAYLAEGHWQVAATEEAQSADQEAYNPYAAYAERYRPATAAPDGHSTGKEVYNPYVAYAERYRPRTGEDQTVDQEAYNPYAVYARYYQHAATPPENQFADQETYNPYAAYAERYRPAAGEDQFTRQ